MSKITPMDKDYTGEFAVGISSPLDLWQVINIEKLQEMQDKFAVATGLAAIIADSEGQAVTRPSNFTDYCKLIRSCPRGQKGCYTSDAAVGMEAYRSKKPSIHYCHAGLIDLAAPIIVHGVYMGSVLCGQVLTSPPLEADFQNVRTRSERIGLDGEKMASLFRKIEIVPEHRVHAAADLLHIMANYVIDMGVSAFTQQRLLEEEKTRADLEKTLKELELKALQSQVNPHFLFNSLNIITRLALFENAPDTQEVAYALAQLLRYSLSNIDQMVAFRDEVAHVEDYLLIQKTRFGDRISASVDVARELMNAKIPLLTLQPLVENAIVHGLEPKEEGGIVFIRGRLKNGNVHIEIEDTGIGMDADTVSRVLATDRPSSGQGHTTGLGIPNVHRRIQHQFGNEYGLRLESQRGKGTKVVIVFPYEKKV